MRVRLLTDNGLIQLKKASEEHPEYYVDTDPNIDDFDTFDYPDFIIPADEYPALKIPEDDGKSVNENDYNNSLILYRFFSENRIPLSLLFDPRYVSYLTHFVYLDYMRVRWPKDGTKSKGRIQDRYFFQRAPYGRQGILGLFWPAYLISLGTDDRKVFSERLHFYFCGDRTLRDSVIEHAYSRNPKLFAAILNNLNSLGADDKFTGKRADAYTKVIQNTLTVTSLDLLPDEELAAVLKTQLKSILAGDYDEAEPEENED